MTSFKEQLIAGRPQLGLCIMYPAPGVIERIGSDWDWVWIDGQHGQLGYGDVIALVRACNLVHRPAMVRVAGHDFGAIGAALDTGAEGVIVPCVDTVAQAESVVRAAKFPPLGNRSYGGRRPIDLAGRGYSDHANEDVLLIVQIESPEAIDNVEAIAALPGVDALFLGPDDLLLRRGHSRDVPPSRVALDADMRAVVKACARHGKYAVMVGVSEEMLQACVSAGFHMIVGGGDVPFLAASSQNAARNARAVIANKSSIDAAIASSQSPSAY